MGFEYQSHNGYSLKRNDTNIHFLPINSANLVSEGVPEAFAARY